MPHGTHDVGLLAVLVDGVTQGFAINRQAVVVLAEGRIPLLQRTVEQDRVNAHQDITDDRLTGD